MPTIVTHAVVGAALARLGPRAVPRKRLVVALVALSALPDLDVVAFHFGIPYSSWLGHRGLSHSPLFAVVVAAVVTWFDSRRNSLSSREKWQLFMVCALAMTSHGMLDAFTNGGLGIAFLLPFSPDRYFFPVQPIAVSPIGLAEFFRGPALAVLSSELLYVWLPMAAVVVVHRLVLGSRRSVAWRRSGGRSSC